MVVVQVAQFGGNSTMVSTIAVSASHVPWLEMLFVASSGHNSQNRVQYFPNFIGSEKGATQEALAPTAATVEQSNMKIMLKKNMEQPRCRKYISIELQSKRTSRRQNISYAASSEGEGAFC